MRFTYLPIVLVILCMPVVAAERAEQFATFKGFELEKTELREIISIFGETEIHKEGDAGESYTGICYYYPKQNVTAFYESGEMGGSTTLLSYQFLSGRINRFSCKTINDQDNTIFAISGLEIGQSVTDALEALPEQPYSIGDMSYTYLNKIPFTESDFATTGAQKSDNPAWSDVITIEIYKDNEVVSGFGISRVITW